MSTDDITMFAGSHGFLSNFAVQKNPSLVRIPGDVIRVPTNEHYFNAYKTIDPEERHWVASAPSAKEAKHRGRQVTLRPDWDRLRLAVMAQGVHEKFVLNDDLAAKLLNTGECVLMEGNTWKDYFWGVHFQTLVGYNWLGRILMLERATLALAGSVEPHGHFAEGR